MSGARRTAECRRIQRLLADAGAEALRGDRDAQEHVAGCGACFAVLEGMAGLDQALAALPPEDAPDEVVAALLVRPELMLPPEDVSPAADRWSRLAAAAGRLARRPVRRRVWMPLAATLAVAVIGGVLELRARRQNRAGVMQVTTGLPDAQPREAYAGQELRAMGSVGGAIPEPEAGRSVPPAPGRRPPAVAAPRDAAGGAPQQPLARKKAVPEGPVQPPPAPPPPAVDESFKDFITVTAETPVVGETRTYSSTYVESEVEPMPTAGDLEAVLQSVPRSERFRLDVGGNEGAAAGSGVSVVDGMVMNDAIEEADVDKGRASEADRLTVADEKESLAGGAKKEASLHEENARVADEGAAREAARRFLATRSRTEGLTFRDATGYWANSYVPGDPALRYLAGRLLTYDRALLAPWEAGAPFRLHDAARRPAQPFDPPRDAALAVYLHADRRAVVGESRLLVQVGLQATERSGGRRPAMNLGVVLDLDGPLEGTTAANLRALVEALGAARDVGDRFQLWVAGRPGGRIAGPEEFRHGPLQVALTNLLADPPAAAAGTTARRVPLLDLPQALEAAIASVAGGDDPDAPLGSSAVLLVTARPLDDALEPLTFLAHTSAVGGVPVSVVGVGDDVDLDALDELAVAGQGSRRFLAAPAEAAELVDRELAAVARVVARAVRLRIRLAPGVRLVDVLGSERLEAPAAERVRQAEKAIDLRLARNLGIAADRGQDEEGIQIVIPAFYAGDFHAVLLDVVAPGPGPVADVTVRYKDLVELGNGVARARLELSSGTAGRGPLERNVLENLLARELQRTLETAGRELADGGDAAAVLAAHRLLLHGLTLELPELEEDPEVTDQLALLDEYLSLLGRGAAEGSAARRLLADSLDYAGQLKVQPRPTVPGGEPDRQP